MGKNIGLIIFLVFVAIQVVMGIVQKIAKEQQEAKMRQVAEERRKRYGTAAPGGERTATRVGEQSATRPSGSDATIATPPVTDPGAQDRLDALAARRKAQLEQLRQRRAQQAGQPQQHAPAPVQARVGGPATAAPRRVATPTPVPVPTAREVPRKEAPGVAAERRQREVEAKRRKRTQDVTRARAAEQLRRESARPGRAEVRSVETGEKDAYAARRGRGNAGGRAGRIRAMLRGRDSIGDAILLAEILDRPVGMRQDRPGVGEM